MGEELCSTYSACDCAKKQQKARDQQRLFQFLMHLRLEFESIRGQLLHKSPLPTLDVALSELIAEEIRLRVLGSFRSAEPATCLLLLAPDLLPLGPLLLVILLAVMHSASLWGAAIVMPGTICSRTMPRRSKLISAGNNPPLQQLLLLLLGLILLRCSMMSQPLQSLQFFLQHMGPQCLSLAQLMQILKASKLGGSTPSTRHATTATTALSTSADRTGISGPSWILDSGASIHAPCSPLQKPLQIFTAYGSPLSVSHHGAITTTGRFFVLSLLHIPKLSMNFFFC